MREAVILSAVRLPTGKFMGALKGFSAPELGAIVVRGDSRLNVPQDLANPAARPGGPRERTDPNHRNAALARRALLVLARRRSRA